MKHASRLAGILLISGLGLGIAQEAAKPTAAQAPRDYSQGFAKLYQLGLPDVSQGKYAKLDIQMGRHAGSGMEYAFSGMRGLRLQGGAWLLKENPGGASVFVTQGCLTLNVDDGKAHMEKLQEEARQRAEVQAQTDATDEGEMVFESTSWMSGTTAGTWKPVDIKRDIDAIFKFLEKPVPKADGDADETDRFAMQQQMQGYDLLFLYAAHFHRAGFTAEANRMVDLISAKAGGLDKVVLSAFNRLANAQYEMAFDRFETDVDWAALHAGLQALAGKFGAGWKSLPAVRRIAETVKIRMDQPEPPAIAGDGVTDEDRQLARDLAMSKATPTSVSQLSTSSWVLPGKAAGRGPQDSALTRITQRGIKSVPLLIALLKDDYPTALMAEREMGGMDISFMLGSMPGMDNEDMMQYLLRSLARPLRRCEIAVRLLRTAVPDLEADVDSVTAAEQVPDGFAEQCQDWYDMVKGKSPLELAKSWLESEDTSRQHTGMSYLLENAAGPDDYAAIEKFILDNPAERGQLATGYIQKRDADGKPFAEKLLALLKAKLPPEKPEAAKDGGVKDDAEDDAMQDGEVAQIRATIKSLERTLNPISFEDMLAELQSGEAEDADDGAMLGYQALMPKVKKDGAEKTTRQILEAAVSAKSAAAASQLLQMISMVQYVAAQATGAHKPGPSSRVFKLDLTDTIPLWRKLLDDKRPAGEESVTESLGPTATVSDLACGILGAPWGDEREMEKYGEAYTLGDLLLPTMRARAEARLNGTPEEELPPLPNAERVTPEQRTKLAAQIKTSTDLTGLVGKLSMDEQLALPEICESDPDVSGKLLPLANRVREVTANGVADDVKARVAALTDRPMDKETVTELRNICEQALKRGKSLSIDGARSLTGFVLRVAEVPEDTGKGRRSRGMGGMMAMMGGMGVPGGGVMATVSGEGYDAFFWPVAGLAATAPEPKPAEAPKDAEGEEDDALEAGQNGMETFSAEQEEQFWDAVEKLRDPEGSPLVQARVMLMGITEAQAKAGRRRSHGGFGGFGDFDAF